MGHLERKLFMQNILVGNLSEILDPRPAKSLMEKYFGQNILEKYFGQNILEKYFGQNTLERGEQMETISGKLVI